MLLILITTIWVAVLLFASMMFRLAAVSDDASADALAERVAAIRLAEQQRAADGRVEQRRFDRRRTGGARPVEHADEELERACSRVRIS